MFLPIFISTASALFKYSADTPKRPDAYCAISLSACCLSSGSIPPSPVLAIEPTLLLPMANAILASLLNAPNDIAPIMIGVSISIGFSANLSPSTTEVLQVSRYESIGGLDTCAGNMLKSSNVGIFLVSPQPLTLYDPDYIACVGHISSQILHPTQFS